MENKIPLNKAFGLGIIWHGEKDEILFSRENETAWEERSCTDSFGEAMV
jgi:hypothetical protein